jgi:serine/threonine protein kinase
LDTSGEHLDLDIDCALPFTHVDFDLIHGAFGRVHKGELHPDHQRGIIKSQVSVIQCQVKYLPTKGVKADGGPIYIAINEVVSIDDESLRAVENYFKNIGQINHQHIVKLIATCNYPTKKYVLFPWPDYGELDNILYREPREDIHWGATSELYMWALRQMLCLASALKALHDNDKGYRYGALDAESILRSKDLDESRGTLLIMPLITLSNNELIVRSE